MKIEKEIYHLHSSTPKRTEVKSARRQLDRMMDDDESQQTPSLNQAGLNQALFQDVSSQLPLLREGGYEFVISDKLDILMQTYVKKLSPSNDDDLIRDIKRFIN